ncbi:MAG: hypothetical protein GY861_04485, partial [bacterium]|nr:hypothetical protein [bacterium]
MKIGTTLRKGCVILFDKENYGGKNKQFCGRAANLGIYHWNNKATSILLGSYTKAILYDGLGTHGKSIQITRNIPKLKVKGWDNKASSLNVVVHEPPPRSGCVKVFENANYKGKSLLVCSTITNLASKHWNNKISSIKLGSKTKVVIYDLPGASRGHRVIFTQDQSNLARKGWNDKASSIRTVRIPPPGSRPISGCVNLYTNPHFGGSRKSLCTTVPNLGVFHWDNKAASMRVGPKTAVTVYDNVGLRGRHYIFYHNVLNFSRKGWGNKISSIHIQKGNPKPRAGCVILYDLYNYKGAKKNICGSVSNLARYHFSNKASSVQVGPGTFVRMYDGINYRGRSVSFSKDYPNLSQRGFTNRVSSMKIFKRNTHQHGNITLTGKLKNAVNGRYLSNYRGFSIIAKSHNHVYRGRFVGNKYILKLPYGKYEFILASRGWIMLKQTKTVSLASARNHLYWDFTISQALPSNQWRFVVTWSNRPRDLDSHMKLTGGEEVYYRHKLSRNRKVKLDVDNTHGYGPETITVTNTLGNRENYIYYVYNFSKRPSINRSHAKVVVYNGNRIVSSVSVPPHGNGLFWYVFDFNCKGIHPVNRVVSSIPTPRPLTRPISGCPSSNSTVVNWRGKGINPNTGHIGPPGHQVTNNH